MLRQMNVGNFRSLVECSISFEDSYTCLVGANDAGKSNVVTAYKWLTDPYSLSDGGRLPSVDLSRTATDMTVRIMASIEADARVTDVPFRFPIVRDGQVHICRDFEFQGSQQESGQITLLDDFGAPTKLYVLAGTTPEGEWRELEESLVLLPKLVHIRPTDIGQTLPKQLTAERDLCQLKWPEVLDIEDLAWVNESLGQILVPEYGILPYQVVVTDTSPLMAVEDKYGYFVPLRKAGTGVLQLVYSLARMALARKQHALAGVFARPLLVVIDEPEQHLSSGLQKAYARFLRQLSQEHQIIVTSHAAPFLHPENAQANCLLIRDHRNGTAQVREDGVNAEIMRRVLGIGISDSLYLGNVTMVVEGDSDLHILQRVLKAVAKNDAAGFSYEDITFTLSPGGASKIPPFTGFIAQLGLPVLVMLDNDKAGKRAEQEITDSGSPVSVIKVPLERERTEAEIEDLLPEDLLISETIAYLTHYRSIELDAADFSNPQLAGGHIKSKKWGQRLSIVLTASKKLPKGKKVDDLIQKTEIVERVLDRLEPLSDRTVHAFLWEEVPMRVKEALHSANALRGRSLEAPTRPNSRAFSWIHPANLVDHLDHDV